MTDIKWKISNIYASLKISDKLNYCIIKQIANLKHIKQSSYTLIIFKKEWEWNERYNKRTFESHEKSCIQLLTVQIHFGEIKGYNATFRSGNVVDAPRPWWKSTRVIRWYNRSFQFSKVTSAYRNPLYLFQKQTSNISVIKKAVGDFPRRR